MSQGYQAEIRVAREAAREACRFLLEQFARRDRLAVETKEGQAVNYVTQADRGSEERIRDYIRKAFPEDAFLGEEEGAWEGHTGRCWIVDPLDGTTNFLHGFPLWSVSIALQEEGDLKVGVVLDPLRKERFEAVRGQGATLGGQPIHVSQRRDLRHALIATGFPFREFSRIREYLAIFETLAYATAGLRRPGVASLDLCYLACGRVDGFWEFGLSAWDVAAASLIIQEAGGQVTDLEGGPHFLQGDIVASNGWLHEALVQIVQAGIRGTLDPSRFRSSASTT